MRLTPAILRHGRSCGQRHKGGRREVTAEIPAGKRAREPSALGLKPADIGIMIGASRTTVYRYLSMGNG